MWTVCNFFAKCLRFVVNYDIIQIQTTKEGLETMKLRAIAILMTAILLFSGLGAIAEATAAPAASAAPAMSGDTVLATVDEHKILKNQADKLIPALVAKQNIKDATDYDTAVNILVRQYVIEQKIEKMGLNKFSEEEKTAFQKDAKAKWNEAISEYVSYNLSEDTAEARAKVAKDAEEYYVSQGYSLEKLTENLMKNASIDKLSQQLLKAYQPSEDEIQKVFQEVGSKYQANYENNVGQYEYASAYYGEQSWYVPAGYRGILHILVKCDKKLMNDYTTLQAKYEEQLSASAQPQATASAEATADPAVVPAAPDAPVTQEQVDAAHQALLDSQKDILKQIEDKLKSGTSFVDLIKEYGTDPGMTDETRLKEGYAVHRDSVIWDPNFVKGAFSDKMQKVGDVSDPVISSNGIHILYYLRDVPSGLIMTDNIKKEISDYLISLKEGEELEKAYTEWAKEFKIVFVKDAIDAATKEAKETAENSEEEQAMPLEATGTEEPAVEATKAP